MNEESLTLQIEKLKYHVRLLADTVNYEEYPVEALVLQKDWSYEDLNRAHDIFEKWEKKLDQDEPMNQYQFEADFDEALGVNYQGLKSIVRAFYRNGQWVTVCEAYVDSMGAAPPIEYHSIMRRERF